MHMLKLGKYKHFKDLDVEVIGIARHSETLEEHVVYREFPDQTLWVRPLAMFTEEVEVKGKLVPRFVYVGELM